MCPYANIQTKSELIHKQNQRIIKENQIYRYEFNLHLHILLLL